VFSFSYKNGRLLGGGITAMPDQFSRTQLLIGKSAVNALKKSRVIVFGVGGVGSFVVEALARGGVGAIEIVDDDKVCLTNLNRQIIALHSTVGKYKVEVMADRILDINPKCEVVQHKCFFLPETADQFDFSKYDYVVDAVDTVAAKLSIIQCAKASGVPVISCMGAGNKLDPAQFHIADISETSICPLARVMRQECKKRGIENVKVLYSTEKPIDPVEDSETSCKAHCICPPGAKHKCTDRRSVPGSISFVPSVAGLIIAGEVIKDLTGVRPGQKQQAEYEPVFPSEKSGDSVLCMRKSRGSNC
jgi:tRNA threonylcarbamoyladenosine dehydratase